MGANPKNIFTPLQMHPKGLKQLIGRKISLGHNLRHYIQMCLQEYIFLKSIIGNLCA